MKRVSIRELHERTGEYVRGVARTGEVFVTYRGKTVAKIVPEEATPDSPYFATRKLTPAFRRLMKSGTLRGGTDSTQIISEDRDRPTE